MTSNNLVFDLNKSSNSSLVQVQRVVTRNGKQFYQKFWVLPNQVNPQDKILSKPNTKSFDLSKFDQLKSTDRLEAMKYAESFGITWNKSDNPGINWMRCNMAIRKFVPSAQSPNKPVKSTQSNSSVNNNDSPLDMLNLSKLDSSAFDSSSGKDKVNSLKSQLSKDELFELSKRLGVTWDINTHAGINNMRMQMALAKYLEDKPLSSLTDQINANTSSNASIKPPEPEVDADMLEVPTNASDRDKNIIEIVNKIEDIDELNTYKKLGILPEDDESKKYLTQKLLPNVNSEEDKVSIEERNKFHGQNYTVNKGLLATMKGFTTNLATHHSIFNSLLRSLNSTYFTAPRASMYIEKLNGMDGTSDLYLATGNSLGYSVAVPFFRNVSELFGEYTVKDHPKVTGLSGIVSGMGSWSKGIYNVQEAKDAFNTDCDGFCVALDIIAENQPELKETTEVMKNNYVDLVKCCNYNIPSYMTYVLEKSDEALVKEEERNKYNKEITESFEKNLTDTIFNGDSSRYKTWLTSHSRKSDYSVGIDFSKNATGHYQFLKTDSLGNSWISVEGFKTSDGRDFEELLDEYGKKYNLSLTNGVVGTEIYKQSTLDFLSETADSRTPSGKAKAIDAFNKLFKLDMNDTDRKSPYNGHYYKVKAFKPQEDDKMDAVMSNMHHMMSVSRAKNDIAFEYSYHHSSSKLNGNGSNLENVFDYYYTSKLDINYGNKNPEYKLYDSSTKSLTHDEFKKYIRNQHKNAAHVYSFSEIQDLKSNLIEFNKTRALASIKSEDNYSYMGGYTSGLDVYRNTRDNQEWTLPAEHPLFNAAVKDLENIVLLNKANRNKRIKTDADVVKLLHNNLGLGVHESESATITKEDRKNLFSAVKCSLKTAGKKYFDDLSHSIKMDWDQNVHGRNSAKIYGAYLINNQEHEKNFKAACDRMRETPKSYYHGTSFQGTHGILGVTGHFRVPKDQTQVSAGAMLGYGVYLANKSSKSAQYFRGYNNGRYGNGSLILCDAILGKQMPYVGSSTSPTYDTYDGTVCATEDMNSRSTLLNDEWSVRNEDFVLPRVLVDMENKRRT